MHNTRLIQIEPEIEHDKLAKLLGSRKRRRLTSSIRTKVANQNKKLGGLIQPSLHYRIMGARIEDNSVVPLNEAVQFRSSKLSKALKKAEKIICFVGTIGDGVEKETNRLLGKQKLAEAYILDAMGSVAVENMVDQFQNFIEDKYASEDKTVTLRFSPGYCDWSITQQKKLFSVFDSEQLRVKLLDSCLMNPRKSISGVFGIAPPDATEYNPCLHCREKNCNARRT